MSDTNDLIINTDVAVSPWNIPVNHGRPRNPIVLEKRLKLAELLLRVTVFGSFTLATLVISTDSEVREIFSFQEKTTYKVMKSFVFLVVVNGILASYLIDQVARCVVSMSRGSVIFNKPLSCAIFSVDQV